MFVAVWIRESGLEPPTHVRANSKPAASKAPPKALTSQARIGQVWLVTLHTRTSLTHWNPCPAGLTSQTRTCMVSLKYIDFWPLSVSPDTKITCIICRLLVKHAVIHYCKHTVANMQLHLNKFLCICSYGESSVSIHCVCVQNCGD